MENGIYPGSGKSFANAELAVPPLLLISRFTLSSYILLQYCTFVCLKVFEANFDRNSIVPNVLLPAILARIVRLHIQSWHRHIAMRVEFFGTYEGIMDIYSKQKFAYNERSSHTS